MQWPRGKYNGHRISGFQILFRIDVLDFGFHLPTKYGSCLQIGWIKVWFEGWYETIAQREAVEFRKTKVI